MVLFFRHGTMIELGKVGAIIAEKQNRSFKVRWLKSDILKQILYALAVICSGGILYLVATNRPGLYLKLTTSECDAGHSEFVRFESDGGEQYTKVQHHTVDMVRYITFEVFCTRHICVFDENTNTWSVNLVPDAPSNFSENFVYSATEATKASKPSRFFLQVLYGPNHMQIPMADFSEVLLSNVTSPFYLFQYCALALWFYQEYYAYSCIILLITIGAIYFTTKEEVFNLERLHKLADSFSQVKLIDEQGKASVEDDVVLLPGDRILITNGMTLPCDCILTSGRVVVDESMLTGESVPVTKTPLDESTLRPNEPRPDLTKRSATLLYSGTIVKYVSAGSIAVVYKTGFRSAKGMLVAALLIPKEEMLKFFADTMQAMGFMIIITTAIFGWSAAELAAIGTSSIEIFLAYLTALTISVPPGLVACLSVATSISIDRLYHRHSISVSETSRVNYAGLVSFASFDKTGTLTDENIDYQGMQLVSPASLQEINALGAQAGEKEVLTPEMMCRELMATCHGMSIVDNVAAGDPLEVELLRASGWSLSYHGPNHELRAIAISSSLQDNASPSSKPSNSYCTVLRHFEFTPEKVRAGSIVRRRGLPSNASAANSNLMYYVKGSPETIIALCDKSSLPDDIQPQLTSLSKRGFRVLAVAYKSCHNLHEKDATTVSQDELEANNSLRYLGLIYFSSKVKAQCPEMFAHFDRALIRSSMITGDHIYTAVAIATECGLLAPPERRKLYIIDANESEEPIIINSEDETVPCTLSFDELFHQLQFAVHDESNRDSSVINPMNAARMSDNNSITNRNTSASVNTNYARASAISPVVEGTHAPINIASFVGPEGTAGVKTTQVAITGKGLNALRNKLPQHVEDLLAYCRVFARMKPEDKKSIVVALQSLTDEDGNTVKVVYCGDGANDMAALSAATVGVSLCDAETTVAASIVSRKQTPTAVVEVLKEGRCCLVTAYCLVSFNILYGIIQLFMTCYLNNMGIKFGDATYLVQDLFFSLLLGLCIAHVGPQDELAVKLPPQRFLCKGLLIKLCGQMVIFPVFQYIGLLALQSQNWYTRYQTDEPLQHSISYETTTVGAIALSQLMLASVVITIGKPFRQPWYESRAHLILMCCQGGWVLYLLFGQYNWFMKDVVNIPVPQSFAWFILFIIACNLTVSAVYTKFADQYL